MPARQSRTRPTTASTLWETTTLLPVVSAIVVSGLDSTVTMRSGFRWNDSCTEPRRWSSIMVQVPLSGLAVEVDQVLQHLVGRRDHARVGLEAALGGDHLRELGGEVDVRHLERARGDDAEGAVLAGGADGLGARVLAGLPAVARQALEALLVRELGQRDVAGGRAP